MAPRRRTEITIETHEITTIRYSTRSRFIRCEQCRIEVPAYSPTEAAAIFGVDVAAVESCVIAGHFHLVGKATQGDLVCGCSLLVGGMGGLRLI